MKKKALFIILFASIFCGTVSAQKFAIKSNILYDAALVPSLGVEMRLGKGWTLDVTGTYNWFELESCQRVETGQPAPVGKFWKNWSVMPEVRYWFCESFNGSFLGLHATGGQYSFSGLKLPFGLVKDLENYRYEGDWYGVGITFGHQWVLGKRWSIEAAIGAGYARIYYEKSNCPSCSPILNDKNDRWTNYWGPTKASVSLMFFLF